jgi:hypothetical protein
MRRLRRAPVGYPLGFPCGRAALRHISRTLILLVSAHRKRISKTMHHVGVTACEQYIIRTMIVSNIMIYLHYLRPERDSNARPTA